MEFSDDVYGTDYDDGTSGHDDNRLLDDSESGSVELGYTTSGYGSIQSTADHSDSDSDASIVNTRITKLDEEVKAFVSIYRGVEESEGGNSGDDESRKRYRRKKKASEARGEAKLRLTQASDAFIAEDYELAMKLVQDVVRINAEVPDAWSLLSAVHHELGKHNEAAMALLFSVQLRPKDVEALLNCAESALRWLRGPKSLEIAGQCYSAALRADPYHLGARLGKASIEHDLGNFSHAIFLYLSILDQDELHLGAIRGFGEACLDSSRSRQAIEKCREAYRRYLTWVLAHKEGGGGGDSGHEDGSSYDPSTAVSWSDIITYSELSSCLGLHAEAIADLKSLGRWLLGRGEDTTWDVYIDDDREWDIDDSRRLLVADFDATLYPASTYRLPTNVRFRLAVYRLRAGNEAESKLQLYGLRQSAAATEESVHFPGSVREVADLLFEASDYHEACGFYGFLRQIAGVVVDVTLLVRLGTCYTNVARDTDAEECYLLAIDLDPSNIEARFQLAKLYEKVHEDNEAYILVTEALKLAQDRGRGEGGVIDRDEVEGGDNNGRICLEYREKAIRGKAVRRHRGDNTRQRHRGDNTRQRHRGDNTRQSHLLRSDGARGHLVKSHRGGVAGPVGSIYRPRRLVSEEQRKSQERTRTDQLKAQYQVVQSLRDEASFVGSPSFSAWMVAAKTLVDDFRSFKEFYHWEKYLRFLKRNKMSHRFRHTEVGDENDEDKEGEGGCVDDDHLEDISTIEPQLVKHGVAKGAIDPQLANMAARLTRHLAPVNEGEKGDGPSSTSSTSLPSRDDYLGIPFRDWLNLFLEYALNLARSGLSHDAYQVCESARDSIIFLQSQEDLLLIHTVWGACAVYAADEQTCVAVARFFMRNYQLSADSSRVFSSLSRLCQAPVCWYSSGPAQKYILRQIRAIDQSLVQEGRSAPSGQAAKLSVSLCMLYGNILFASTSYTYALNYFLRAYAVDPENSAICLGIGLSYVHYSIKRQCDNRQYLILQAFTFLFKYRTIRAASAGNLGLMEADYNLGRVYQMLGLGHLALHCYEDHKIL
ncbi:hypothetical protein MKZ38_006393 [Zalerion maritima]|uniref:Uncharacterized protein n=1 Tax=Zalerion maritima TaxID=339359 RepID=A0AAD5RIX0_9PEZI|nr:hypothetical protein MKZ38_006393 [Zalerion maritima]